MLKEAAGGQGLRSLQVASYTATVWERKLRVLTKRPRRRTRWERSEEGYLLGETEDSCHFYNAAL
jgi:hypothetical protein